MAIGDKFFWTDGTNTYEVAVQNGYKFATGSTSIGGKEELTITTSYLSRMRPELLLVLTSGISIQYVNQNKPGTVLPSQAGPIIPRPGAVLRSQLPNGNGITLSRTRLSRASISSSEVTGDYRWFITASLTFEVPEYDTEVDPQVAVVNFSSAIEDAICYEFTTREPDGGGSFLFTPGVPAINSAGSPIEMTAGKRQTVMTTSFQRSAVPAFDPVWINDTLVGSVNLNSFMFAGRVFASSVLRLDKYDATPVPVYDITAIPTGYYYDVEAQLTFDRRSFFRPLLDAGLMLKSASQTGGLPRHVWACDVESSGNITTNFGTKGSMLALESGDHKAEKITTAVLLDGNGWPSAVDPVSGRQAEVYRSVLNEDLFEWPNVGSIMLPEGLLPPYIVTF